MNFKHIEPESEEQWLELRTRVLTASDMSVVLGLNKWKSVKELLESKQEYVPFENAYTWLGQILEPVVVHATNKVLDSNFSLFEDTGSRSFYADMTIGMGATPDATDGERLLECKSTKPHNYLRWFEWPPAYYLAQLYTQLICTEKRQGLLSIMSTDLTQKSDQLKLPINIYTLDRSDEIDEYFFSEVKRFWTTLDAKKQFRVARKKATWLETLMRIKTKRIY